MKQIAIVGAGIAAQAAAKQLKQSGFGIALFENSRVVSGRM
jgi:predicted NAD/FAD-dependent oxidoreductase